MTLSTPTSAFGFAPGAGSGSSRAALVQPRDEWLADSLDDDMVPAIAGLGDAPFALATLIARDGGPRPVGAQMVVTADRHWGFMSGGCVEGDIAVHARAALADGRPRWLAYGRGSAAFDIRLPCGGRIEVLVEPMTGRDPAIVRLLDLAAQRRPARYLSDGRRRLCIGAKEDADGAWVIDRTHQPRQRLLVVGSDAFAVAIAQAGWHQGWDTRLISMAPPAGSPPPGLGVLTAGPCEALAALVPDAWTAVAVATHDADEGDEALAAALASRAGYVGALGSRRRIADRCRALRAAGVSPSDMARLRAPIGLPIGAAAPREIAASVIAEIIALRSGSVPAMTGGPQA